MPKPPSAPEVTMKFVIEQSEETEAKKGFSNKLEQFTFTTHVATHYDAPSHFTVKGRNIDEYPMEYFYMVPTLVLDIPKDIYGEISVEDIRKAERECGNIHSGDLVLINTGSYKRYYDAAYNKSPYLTEEAACYLASKGIKMLGIDSFTVDDPRKPEKPAHVVLLKDNGILIIECVTNLNRIPEHRFNSIGLPINIKDGSGAFVRLVGVFSD